MSSVAQRAKEEGRGGSFLDHKWTIAVGIMIAVWAALLVAVQLAQHYSFQTGGRDMGFFDHALSNTLQGRFLYSSLLPDTARNYFGFHFCPIILLFLPLYMIWDGPEVILITQALVMAASAIPLFLMVRKLTKPSWAFLAVAIYLLYRPMTRAAACTYHQETFFPLFVMAAAYAYFVLRSRPWGWFWAALCLLTKEDVSVYFIPVGILMLFRKEYRVDAAILLAVCVTYFGVVNKVIVPRVSTGGSTEWPSHFRGYGSTPLELIMGVMRHPFQFLGDVFDGETITTTAEMLVLLAFIPLLSVFSLPALPPALANFLSTLSIQRTLGIYYAATVFPYLFLGFAWGLKRLSSWVPEKQRNMVVTSFLIVLVAANAANSSFVQWLRPSHWAGLHWTSEAKPVLAKLPPGVDIEIQNCLIPHLRQEGREYTIFPDAPDAEYVLVFRGADPWPMTQEKFDERIDELLANPSVEVVAENGGCLLLRRSR